MSDIELLSCPFCGCKATFLAGRDDYRIAGKHSQACPFLDIDVVVDSRDAWNTRAGFTAVDMATAAADGFRDGTASRGAEIEALCEVALELRVSAACENVLHYPRDSHNSDQPCPVLERIDAVLKSSACKEG